MKKQVINKTVVLIPSLNPNNDFYKYSKKLISKKNIFLIVVDDGSREEFKPIFEKIEKLKNTIVLRHAVNLGKGRALKTGFNYYINNFNKDEYPCIITADSDGQHKVEDVLSISKEISKIKENDVIILGTRDFNNEIVPFKSRNGNKITIQVFKLLYGKRINDTQTGLRGLTYEFAKKCISLNGERFEYEISMLIKAVNDKIKIIEYPIETVYFNNNSETHFDPIKDSLKIYYVMFKEFLKFTISGISSAILDLLLFTFIYNILKDNIDKSILIFLPTLIARFLSSLYNYNINKNIVFKNKSKRTMSKYYVLCVCQGLLSWLLVENLFNNMSISHPGIIKIFVDFILFLISYQIQQRWVFNNKV